MRMNLAVLDWVSTIIMYMPHPISIDINFFFQNENCQRASTSERFVQDMRRPDRRTPRRVLVDKTFGFVETIWSKYQSINEKDTT